MQNRTHLAIGILFMIIFLKHVANIIVFIPVFLIATLLPNFDQIGSRRGRGGNVFVIKSSKIISKTKGFLHSFTFCLIITMAFVWYLPVFAFPFFLGYSLNLLADTWTVEGIRPFWPLKTVSKGRVQIGGKIEDTIFFIFVILDLAFLFIYLI